MLKTITGPATFSLNATDSSAFVEARTVIRTPTETGYDTVGEPLRLSNFGAQSPMPVALAPGLYRVFVEFTVIENQNGGRYDYRYAVNGADLFTSHGDVNTSADPHDTRVAQQDFLLVVKPAGQS